MAGTYYAQAREYQADVGRFQGMDLIVGFVETPFSMNRYGYCFNSPMILIDINGEWPSLSDIGNGIKKAVGKAWDWAKENKENLIKIGVGIGVAAIGVGITVATGGAALPAMVAAGKAIAISGVTSAALSGGITTAKLAASGELNEPGAWKKVAKSAWDGLADGVMWGGIMAGGSQTLSGIGRLSVKQGWLRSGRKGGIDLWNGRMKVFSPDSTRHSNPGGTILKIGDYFQLDVKSGPEATRLLHIHLHEICGDLHISLGLILTSILPGIINNKVEDCD